MSIVRPVEREQGGGAARAVHARVMAALGQRGGAGLPLRVGQVACGDGGTCRLWAERGHEVFGVDESRALIALARRQARHAGLEITFNVATAMALPWPDHSMDMCLNSGASESAYWREIGLDEMVRVLKPGGALCLTNDDAAVRRSLAHRGMLVLDRFELARCAARTPLARAWWTLMHALASLRLAGKIPVAGSMLLALKAPH